MFKSFLFAFGAVFFASAASAQVKLNPKNMLANKSSKFEFANSRMAEMQVQEIKGNVAKLTLANAKHSDTGLMVPSVANAPLTRAENAEWWNYASGTSINLYSMYSLVGDTYHMAVVIPSSLAGAVIDSLEVYFYDVSSVSNIRLWADAVETSMPSTAEEADVYVSVSNDDVALPASGYVWPTRVALPESFTVPTGGCLIGYSFNHDYAGTGDYADYPVLTYADDDIEGGFYIYSPTESVWYTMYSSGAGNLTLGAYVNLDNVEPSYMVEASSITEMPCLVGEPCDVYVPVMNDGYTSISSVTYTVTFEGTTSAEQTYTFDGGLAGLASGYVVATVTPTSEGVKSVVVTITGVDGNANEVESPYNQGSGNVLAMTTPMDRTAVVEEFTSTSCGYCPRGHVGLEMLKESLGDGVITLAGHYPYSYDDPMYCEDYYYVMYYYCSGFPGAAFDRGYIGDPYGNGFKLDDTQTHYVFDADYVSQLVGELYPSEASLTLSADWADADSTSITATVEATFAVERTSSPYGVAFILSEDGMTGSGTYWMQLNYYSGYSSATSVYNDDLSYWFNAGQYVTYSYDNVIVGAWDALSGVSGVFEAPLSTDTPYDYTRTLSIANNTLIQNKENLKLTALIINQNNGLIVNAAQVPLSETVAAGIAKTEVAESDVVEVARYNANGVQLSAPAKGLNIVKYSDGTVEKVVVK